MAQLFQVPSKLPVVVDFTVVHDVQRPAAHGLVALVGQVDDRQPAMAQPDLAPRWQVPNPLTAGIGPAVRTNRSWRPAQPSTFDLENQRIRLTRTHGSCVFSKRRFIQDFRPTMTRFFHQPTGVAHGSRHTNRTLARGG